jgi:hypothetical protein
MPADEFNILVGRSSQDIELHGSVAPAAKAN